MRHLAALAAAAALLGCYTPKGGWVWVSDYTGAGASGEYVIVPGDVLQVRVFQQDAMSARVRVRTDGKVSLPLVNDQTAAGKTPVVLAAELQARLKAFINTPVVTVSLEEARPLSVSVLGEVARPGIHALEAGAGVTQALAAAGGLTDFAQREGIFVLRASPGEPPSRIRFTWEALSRGEPRSATFLLHAGDVVVVE